MSEFEEHMRIVREQKVEASACNQFYVIEKVYGDRWAPLWLEFNCSKEGAEALVKGRNVNYPDEVLRVATYCRMDSRQSWSSGMTCNQRQIAEDIQDAIAEIRRLRGIVDAIAIIINHSEKTTNV